MYIIAATFYENNKGNTAQSLCGKNADIFFVRLHRIFESILSYDEKIMCKMTKNLQVYDVLRAVLPKLSVKKFYRKEFDNG